MFSQKNKIKKKKEFEIVFKKGESFSRKAFLLKIKKNNLNFSRFAFVCPIKVEKKATKRNKSKRIFREIIISLFPFIKGGFDIIFITQKNAQKMNYGEIKREVEKLFKKIKIII